VLAGERAKEDHAERVEIDAVIDVLRAARLLGRHVVGRAEGRAGARRRFFRRAERRLHLADAEVEHLHEARVPAAPREEDVLRLQIAVHDLLGVHRLERFADLRHHVDDVGDRQRAARADLRGEVVALEQLEHHEHRAVVGGAEVEHLDDVLVADRRRRERLATETRDDVRVTGVVRVEQLHRHALPDAEVLRFVDRAHSACRERAVEPIATAEDRPESRVVGRRHGGECTRDRSVTVDVPSGVGLGKTWPVHCSSRTGRRTLGAACPHLVCTPPVSPRTSSRASARDGSRPAAAPKASPRASAASPWSSTSRCSASSR
jgi:hypothetical protein